MRRESLKTTAQICHELNLPSHYVTAAVQLEAKHSLDSTPAKVGAQDRFHPHMKRFFREFLFFAQVSLDNCKVI